MALTADQITAQNFKDFFGQIRPYLGISHAGFTPIGTVIAVMGNSAPLNYLACDGTAYNITAYPELAAYFTAQFGSVNFFGGDGITTFAVPDLRGEFLRGTGTNSHTNQGSGANVGVHQDASTVFGSYSSGYIVSASASNILNNYDHEYSGTANKGTSIASEEGNTYGSVRPTNTSVLYCIACKNIFMDAGANYTTDEQVVGTWIDGKPVYQKVWVINQVIQGANSLFFNAPEIATMDTVIFTDGVAEGSGYPTMTNSRLMNVSVDRSNNAFVINQIVTSGIVYTMKFAIARYTKTTD